MIKTLMKFFARRYWHRVESGWKAELARLADERRTWRKRHDHATRQASNAAGQRVFVDIARPKITHAPGRARRYA